MRDDLQENREQIEYWNGPAGERWVRHQASITRALRPFGLAALDRLAPCTGECILDVGCGSGDTVLDIAQRLAGSGEVVGVDASQPLLLHARERAGNAAGVRFIQADVSRHGFGRRFDALFSRFGVMFFADPLAAFRNLHGALAPGGRLVFACWQGIEDNAWCTVPLAVARQLLPEPLTAVEPGAPGPFAFADPRHVRRILSGAGFSRIEVASFHAPVVLSEEGLDAAIDFLFHVGPVARLFAEQTEPARDSVRHRLRSALAHASTATTVALDGAVWLVSARA